MTHLADDRMTLLGVLDGYTDAINHRDWARLQALFVADASWQTLNHNLFAFRGAAEIANGLRAIIEGTEMLFQTRGATIVHIDGDSARMRSSMQEAGRMRDGTSFFAFGSYSDVMVREGSGWCFVERSWTTLYWEDNTMNGRSFPVPERIDWPAQY